MDYTGLIIGLIAGLIIGWLVTLNNYSRAIKLREDLHREADKALTEAKAKIAEMKANGLEKDAIERGNSQS